MIHRYISRFLAIPRRTLARINRLTAARATILLRPLPVCAAGFAALVNGAEIVDRPEFSLVFPSSGIPWASPREVAQDSHGNLVVVGHGGYLPEDFPDIPVKVIGAVDNSTVFVISLSSAGRPRWVTLIGGTQGTGAGAGRDRGYGLALDSEDNIYIAGQTASTDFPTTQGAFDRTHNGGVPNRPHGAHDAYVLKLSPDGRKLLYSTFLGGSRNDGARGGLEIDSAGNAYVVGFTASPDYLGPLDSHINRHNGGKSDGFVTKVSADGSRILFNRFFGTPAATSREVILGARIGASGNLYLSGSGGVRTAGPSANDYTAGQGGKSDIYLAKISGDGRELMYSIYFGGSSGEHVAHRMGIDTDENVYVSGSSTSKDLPQINAQQPDIGGGSNDGFLLKLDAHGKLLFSTYLGGSESDDAYGPSVDNEGYVYVTGRTASPDFPVTDNAMDKTYNGGAYDTFLRVYDPAGKLVYSTFLGGDGDDYSRYAVAAGVRSAVIAGYTTSDDFPVSNNAGRYDGKEGLLGKLGSLFGNSEQKRLFITSIRLPDGTQ
jgi:hypothetical protein